MRCCVEDELSIKKGLLAADLEDRCGEMGRLEAWCGAMKVQGAFGSTERSET